METVVAINSSTQCGMEQPGFVAVTLAQLAAADTTWTDTLSFGVIGFAPSGEVEVYNATEAAYAGLDPKKVIGRPFFLSVAPCMNNYLVAQRFEDTAELDTTIDYVLTFRMRPTPVQLRLLKGPVSRLSFVLIQR